MPAAGKTFDTGPQDSSDSPPAGACGSGDISQVGTIVPPAKAARSPRLRRVSSPHSKGCRRIAMFPVARRVIPSSSIPVLRIRSSAAKTRSPWSAATSPVWAPSPLWLTKKTFICTGLSWSRLFARSTLLCLAQSRRQHVEKARGRTSIACDVCGSHSITAIGAECYE